MKKINRQRMWLVTPVFCVFMILYVLPFVVSIYYTFVDSTFSTQFVGLKNYADVVYNPYFQLALRNTVESTIISVPLLIAISLILALASHSLGARHIFLRTSFVMPILLPTAAIIHLFRLYFGGTESWILLISHILGLPDSMMHSIPILLLFLWKNTGFSIILLKAALVMIPHNLNEAAMIDGASKYQQLYRITMPLTRNTLFFVILMSVVQSFRIFRESYLLYGAYPSPGIYTVQHYMNNQFNKLNYQKLSSGAQMFALLVIVTVAIFFLAERKMDISL